jgi:hypothetical protein
MVWVKRYNNNLFLNGYRKYSCQPQRIVEIEERERERSVDSAVSAKKWENTKVLLGGKSKKPVT